jgi:pimeloyl-ACP methyl ester carboxylesterase
MTTVDWFPVPVSLTGTEGSPVVVVLCAAERSVGAYDALCERLHTARLRTLVVGPDPRLSVKSIVGIVDSLDIQWGVVVGDQLGGGDLAWELAAHKPDRFTGLVVVDAGHPRVADQIGVVRDEECPQVEINTTVLVSTAGAQQAARASRRFVRSDFRVVELSGRRSAQEGTAQLAAEIVLRTSTW